MADQIEVLATATGKRKSSIARVRIASGTGQFSVNGRTLDVYFPRETLRMVIREPLEMVNAVESYDVFANITGGGVTGQAGALRHGISRALEKVDPGLRHALKRGGLLTRDARVKERKKYGQKGARARFQFSKR